MKYQILNGWTKDQMIERIMRYVPEEGCRDASGACVYHRKDGARCAAGAMLDDILVQQIAEDNLSWWNSAKRTPQAADVVPLNWNGMMKLQQVHDNAKGRVREAVINFIETSCYE